MCSIRTEKADKNQNLWSLSCSSTCYNFSASNANSNPLPLPLFLRYRGGARHKYSFSKGEDYWSIPIIFFTALEFPVFSRNQLSFNLLILLKKNFGQNVNDFYLYLQRITCSILSLKWFAQNGWKNEETWSEDLAKLALHWRFVKKKPQLSFQKGTRDRNIIITSDRKNPIWNSWVG